MPEVKLLVGDALTKLRELPDGSVQCCVTSPPYWGLRDYSKCSCATYHTDTGESVPDPNCSVCSGTGIIAGVKENQLGLEPTPEEYVQRLVEIFREVRRVLRADGTVWLNLGDSYAGSGKGYGGEPDPKWPNARSKVPPVRGDYGLKPKDLVGIPWRVAFALQADGWYLRSDIIWSKPNPMPESVRDRPTKSHEYVFLLSKSDKYYFDQEAVREKADYDGRRKLTMDSGLKTVDTPRPGNPQTLNRDGGDRWPSKTADGSFGRNIRSVWAINTQPYPKAHFATFPEELPERCIKAGTSEVGRCSKCGAPYERMVERVRPDGWEDSGVTTEKEKALREMSLDIYGGNQKSRSISDIYGRATKTKIVNKGWNRTCDCSETKTVPCVVLDPFAGSGTTGRVARRLGRDSVLIEVNPVYADLIRERAYADVPDFFKDVNE